ncbi:MAG TPA: amidohydrolase [Phycisphaerae bacterium]|nr:amidohydrolase [Phycisphaerae bacterium]HOJ56297.1 amidohydrolase [Phycisphaerae bacterium]HOL28202.1 amidohydrolase [Phycisphaerae bacterium]HPP22444.1 amidohydrolase [Phycisphaerae bacterium]HPU32561.1 amidohydrolase [Phycisphaerae bacterium]
MKELIVALAGCITMLNSVSDVRGSALAPDLIILNASVRTMDNARPTAEALAILGNRVVAVGSTAEIRTLAGPATRTIDAGGKLVLPGFNDAHVHFLMGGFALLSVDLRDARTPEEMARRLGEYAKKLPKGTWILEGNWDHEKWPGTPLPTRQMIDAVTPDHPVMVSRLDGHMVLVNSLALRLAGVTKETQDPPGGLIVRDPKTGEPTGVLKDTGEDLIARVIPAKSFEEKLAAARVATEHAARLGVTSVTDVSAGDDVGLYQYMIQRGELKTRIYGARSIVSWDVLAKTGVQAGFGSDMLRIGCVKGFADGSLGSSTALFFEPYNDAPGTRGLLFDQMLPEGIMLERVTGADKAGLQVLIHAIGDEANLRILDIYRQAAEKNGPRDRRFRIEHAQHLRPSEIRRFGQQKVIASMQPYHAADDGRWCDKRIGPERSKGAYAFRSLLDAGVTLAFGSDWSVASLNPLEGIKAAVTRQTLDGGHPDGWIPEQKISVDDAVRAYTVGAAYAEFAEHVKGSLAPGKLADLVMLDRDIYTIDPAEIDKVRVVLTVMDGKVVYEGAAE